MNTNVEVVVSGLNELTLYDTCAASPSPEFRRELGITLREGKDDDGVEYSKHYGSWRDTR